MKVTNHVALACRYGNNNNNNNNNSIPLLERLPTAKSL
jgi:hypothetical protein